MATPERPIRDVLDACRHIRTPYYLIDESRLLPNLERIAMLRERTGVRSVLALKCFSTPALFDLMRPYLDGTTSSSLYEARLGHERFGKETHVYGVAFSDDEIEQARPIASKVIFNSVSQLERHCARVRGVPLGLRVNPGVSYSRFDLADPARAHSRLGVTDVDLVDAVAGELSGLMFHCNCENGDLTALAGILDHIGRTFDRVLHRMDWISLGGGISFTAEDYPFDAFCDLVAGFRVTVRCAAVPRTWLSGRGAFRLSRHAGAGCRPQRARDRRRRRGGRGPHAGLSDLWP